MQPGDCTGNYRSANRDTGSHRPAQSGLRLCEEQGYTLEMREETGGTYGVCLFPDGSECDEWAYFRGECRPGDSLTAPGWQVYHHETPVYTFQCPIDAIIQTGDDPNHAITVLGPLLKCDNWPMIFMSHPQNEIAYQPPDGVDLVQWLRDQLLMPPDEETSTPATEERLADTTVAGVTAVHTCFNRSQQSYAYDKYFFAYDGQLYVITIVHTGDREDWDVCNHFLTSFQLE